MYLITVKTLSNEILSFKVSSYEIIEGFVSFWDRDNLKKKFPIERCQIEELRK
jgi:hypothetical protein